MSLGYATNYDLVECPTCGVRRFAPLPDLAELQQFYASQYHGRDWYKQQGLGMAFANSLLPRNGGGRFLDVGCGLGFFLDGIRQHSTWEVSGVELSSCAADFARRELSLDVRQGELTEARFPAGYFDYIHVCNVLEHVCDPVGLLSECRRIIKPSGTLHLRVPNGRVDCIELINFFRRERKPALSTSGHLFFFPRRTLRLMLADAGFEPVTSKTYGIRRGLRRLGLYPRWPGRGTHQLCAANGTKPAASKEIVLAAQKQRPDIYYRYRFFQLRMKMLPGLHEFGLDFLLLLRPTGEK